MQAPFADPLSGLGIAGEALPLVGRDTEMQVMRLLLKTVALDLPTGSRALTISGEMGVGKSRLLAEMYTEARSLGFVVLEGRAFESGMKFPYLPFFEALRRCCARLRQSNCATTWDCLPRYRAPKSNRVRAGKMRQSSRQQVCHWLQRWLTFFPSYPGCQVSL